MMESRAQSKVMLLRLNVCDMAKLPVCRELDGTRTETARVPPAFTSAVANECYRYLHLFQDLEIT